MGHCSLQPLINCSLTPSIVVTKTSGKFAQWLDPRTKTLYGFGFQHEMDADTVSSIREKPGLLVVISLLFSVHQQVQGAAIENRWYTRKSERAAIYGMRFVGSVSGKH